MSPTTYAPLERKETKMLLTPRHVRSLHVLGRLPGFVIDKGRFIPKEGGSLWYIGSPNDPLGQEECIHSTEPSYYQWHRKQGDLYLLRSCTFGAAYHFIEEMDLPVGVTPLKGDDFIRTAKQMFSHLEKHTTFYFPGTGICDSQIYELLERSGGKVLSTNAMGTWLYLPQGSELSTGWYEFDELWGISDTVRLSIPSLDRKITVLYIREKENVAIRYNNTNHHYLNRVIECNE